MIRELLEAGRPLPPHKAERVSLVMLDLQKELATNLQKEYVWLASCTVAVDAGSWTGRRRVKRRQKLRSMIQTCASYLGVPDPTGDFPERWEYVNLYFGYSSHEQYARAKGMTRTGAFVLSTTTTLMRKGYDELPALALALSVWTKAPFLD